MENTVKSNLFSIQRDYLKLMEAIENNDGILEDDMLENLEENKSELTRKTESYGFMIERTAQESDFVAKKIKELQAYKKTMDNLEQKLKDNLLRAMETFEMDEITTTNFRFGKRRSKSVEISVDVDALPNDCKIYKASTISKTELKKMIEGGREIEGVSIVQNVGLTIKSK